MLTVLQELRVGARLVARRPGFAVVVIATLALGIGAVTTCFAILNAVAFKPLPFTDPDRLFAVRSVGRTGDAAPLTLDTVAALRQTSGTFSGIAGYATRAATIAGTVVAQKVQAARVTGDLFSLLGVPVQRGRSLAAADSGTRVAVISDDLWTDAWGSNPDVVGATLSLDGETYVVVGVAARGFGFPQSARVWVPFERSAVPRSAEIVMRPAREAGRPR